MKREWRRKEERKEEKEEGDGIREGEVQGGLLG